MQPGTQWKAYRNSLGMVLSLLVTLGGHNSMAWGQKYIFGKAEFGTGEFPFDVKTGDFNKDGKLDLVVANSGNGSGNTVSILLGKPDGTFETKVDYPVGTSPQSVVVGH